MTAAMSGGGGDDCGNDGGNGDVDGGNDVGERTLTAKTAASDVDGGNNDDGNDTNTIMTIPCKRTITQQDELN